MTFNRVQMLRNKPIRIARDKEDSYLYVQGPTIGQIYEDEKLFLLSQVLMMEEKELKNFLQINIDGLDKLSMITIMLTQFKEKNILLEKIKQIILDLEIVKAKIYINEDILTKKELSRIEEILLIVMGQKRETKEEEHELSPEEKRIKELEEKVQAKKNKQKSNEEKDEQNIMEDIMIGVIYEFGFSLEQIMNMNYFTLIWYYSYTGKLHVYRINQHAIGSGMVKKINTDYFTSLK